MNFIPKGTKVRITREVTARGVEVGDIRILGGRFELPESQGGLHYRISSPANRSGFAGPLVPADAVEVIS